MKLLVLNILIASLSCLDLIAQSDNLVNRYYFKVDSKYLLVDDNKDNWFTLEFKADTLFQNEDNLIIYDNKKLLQINVIPFSRIIQNQKRSITIPKALQAYKKWELDYQQKQLKTKLKNGEEFYYRDNKPFLIWWSKNPPGPENDTSNYNEKEYDIETGTFVDGKTLNVSYMLCLNFSIYGNRNVALTIPVYEDENLKEEVNKMKEVANSLRVYGGNIDMGVLLDKKKSNDIYILHDSLNYLELEVPVWLNVIKTKHNNMFGATFPEKHEVVNAMVVRWEYKSDSFTFNDFVNQSKSPHKDRTNYRLIEENDSTLKYFYTSENSWFYSQNVYLKGNNIYCFINFTATKNTYDENIGKFEEIVNLIKLK